MPLHNPLRRRPGGASPVAAPAGVPPGENQPAAANPPAPARPAAGREPSDAVAWPVRVAASWSWRIVIIGLLAFEVLEMAARLALITYSLLIALLLAALLAPATRRLRTWGVGRALSTVIVFVGGIAAVAGILTVLVTQLLEELPGIADATQRGIEQIQTWLIDGPLNLAQEEVNRYVDQAQDYISTNASQLTTGALGTALAVGEFTGGLALMLFTAFFFLLDGPRIWSWVVSLMPRAAERPTDEAGRRAWVVLVAYVRSVVLIAAIDAVFIGALLILLDIPLAVPLAILVFFGAFVPLVGATITGAIAVLVALVFQGPLVALAVLGGIILVQQIEGNVLQPVIMSRFVEIHPLAVALSVTAGALVAGIGGAVVAVPLVAVVNTVVTFLSGHSDPAPEAG